MHNQLEDNPLTSRHQPYTKKHLVADQKIPAGRGSNPCAPTQLTLILFKLLTNMLMVDALSNYIGEVYASRFRARLFGSIHGTSYRFSR